MFKYKNKYIYIHIICCKEKEVKEIKTQFKKNMISNVNNQQQQQKQQNYNNMFTDNSLAISTTMSSATTAAKTNSNTFENLTNNNHSQMITKNLTNNNNNNNFSNSLDNGFSIYDKNIDFSLNFVKQADNQSFNHINSTKDSQTVKMENGRTNNGEYIHVNNNYELTSLHNYSKVPVNDDNNNARNDNFLANDEDENEADEYMDDNNNTNNKNDNFDNDSNDAEKTPDHHARRPMNAFLIFCKRHRALVREKYPNLENR